jgi:hypothetical protein
LLISISERKADFKALQSPSDCVSLQFAVFYVEYSPL